MSPPTHRGTLLGQARRRAGIGQRTLATLCGVDQSTVSRWEHDLLWLPDHLFWRLLTTCGARLTGEDRLDDVLTMLDPEGLEWYRRLHPRRRLAVAAAHLAALDTPLLGIRPEALPAVLRLVGATADEQQTGPVVVGALATALHTPDIGDHPRLGWLDLEAPAGHPAWGLPARLRGIVQVRVALPADPGRRVSSVRVGTPAYPASLLVPSDSPPQTAGGPALDARWKTR